MSKFPKFPGNYVTKSTGYNLIAPVYSDSKKKMEGPFYFRTTFLLLNFLYFSLSLEWYLAILNATLNIAVENMGRTTHRPSMGVSFRKSGEIM